MKKYPPENWHNHIITPTFLALRHFDDFSFSPGWNMCSFHFFNFPNPTSLDVDRSCTSQGKATRICEGFYVTICHHLQFIPCPYLLCQVAGLEMFLLWPGRNQKPTGQVWKSPQIQRIKEKKNAKNMWNNCIQAMEFKSPKKIPSREWTYPTFGKGKSFSIFNSVLGRNILVPRRVPKMTSIFLKQRRRHL